MKKSPLFYLLFLCLFGSASVYFTPRLLSFLVVSPNWVASVAVLAFCGIFNLFIYYVLFNALSLGFSMFLKGTESIHHECTRMDTNGDGKTNGKRVALLYLTKDDFKENACLSCVEQDGPNFQVFILDDSTTESKRKEVDAFASAHSEKVQVIRRKEREGFKAGNLNHALRQIHLDFPFFAVSDSDGILPKDFLSSCMKHFQSDDVGFVQARCKANPDQDSSFARSMAPQVEIHWTYFVPWHERFGSLMFYGHSAVIRTKTWEEVGGFPEVVSEDLAFSIRIREKGYFGVLSNEVWTLEDVPETYARFRSRHEKWVRGTTEVLCEEGGRLLRSKNISWFEKLDIFSSAFSLLMSAPFVLFVCLVAFFLPFWFKGFQTAGSVFLLPVATVGKQAGDYLAGFRYNVHWSPDFFFLVALGAFFPALPVVCHFKKQILKGMQYVGYSTGVYASLALSSSLSILALVLTGRSFFPVTGDTLSGASRDRFLDLRANSGFVQMLEFLAATLLTGAAWMSGNLWLLPVALGSWVALMALWFSSLKVIWWLPLLVQAGLLALIGKNLLLS